MDDSSDELDDSSTEEDSFWTSKVRQRKGKRWLDESEERDTLMGDLSSRSRKKRRIVREPRDRPPMQLTSDIRFSFVKGGVVTVDDMDHTAEQSAKNKARKTESEMKGSSDGPLSSPSNAMNSRKPVSKMTAAEMMNELRKDKSRRHDAVFASMGLPQSFGSSVMSSSSSSSSSSYSRSTSASSDRVHNSSFVPVAADPGFAQWSGSSFGLKLLQKHGFRGRLGKREQGISAPIQAAGPRRGFTGLGAQVGGEHTRINRTDADTALEKLRREVTAMRAREDAESSQRRRTYQLKTDDARKPTERVTKTYQSASDLMKDASMSAGGSKGGNLVVHDFTQAEGVRVLRNPVRIPGSQHSNSVIVHSTPMICEELITNVDTIVDMCDADAERKRRELEHCRHRAHSLQIELERVTLAEKARKEEETRMIRIRELVSSLKKNPSTLHSEMELMDDDDNNSDVNWSELNRIHQVFTKLTTYQREYLTLGLWKLIPIVVFPVMKAVLFDWDPMKEAVQQQQQQQQQKSKDDNHYGQCESKLSILSLWHDVLTSVTDRFNMLDFCVDQVFLPIIRHSIRDSWNILKRPNDGVLLVSYLNKNEGVFPKSAIRHVCISMVIPKLESMLHSMQKNLHIKDDITSILACLNALSLWFNTGILGVFHCDDYLHRLSLNMCEIMKHLIQQCVQTMRLPRKCNSYGNTSLELCKYRDSPGKLKDLIDKVDDCCSLAIEWKQSDIFTEQTSMIFERIMNEYVLPSMIEVNSQSIIIELVQYDYNHHSSSSSSSLSLSLDDNDDSDSSPLKCIALLKQSCKYAAKLLNGPCQWSEYCMKGIWQPWLCAIHEVCLKKNPSLNARMFQVMCVGWVHSVSYFLRSALNKSWILRTEFAIYHATVLDVISAAAVNINSETMSIPADVSIILRMVDSDIPLSVKSKLSEHRRKKQKIHTAGVTVSSYSSQSSSPFDEGDHSSRLISSSDLRSTVSKYAQMRGALFTPKFGYFKDGNQLYSIGNDIELFISDGLIFSRKLHRKNDTMSNTTDQEFKVTDLSELC